MGKYAEDFDRFDRLHRTEYPATEIETVLCVGVGKHGINFALGIVRGNLVQTDNMNGEDYDNPKRFIHIGSAWAKAVKS